MEDLGDTLELKGIVGRWSSRYFTLSADFSVINDRRVLLLKTYAQNPGSNNVRAQSERHVHYLTIIRDRGDNYRSNRFNLHVEGNRTISLAAGSAEVRERWHAHVLRLLGPEAVSSRERGDSDASAQWQAAHSAVPYTSETGQAGGAGEEPGAREDEHEDETEDETEDELKRRFDFSDETVERYRAAFNEADREDDGTDGDAVLNFDELHAVATNLGHSLEEGEAEDMLVTVDLDGDGGISFLEFLKAMGDRRWGMNGDGSAPNATGSNLG